MPRHTDPPRVGDEVDYLIRYGTVKITKVGPVQPNGHFPVTFERDGDYDPDEKVIYGAPSNPPTGGGG